MIIQLKKFGDTLVSRDGGKEALAAFRPTLQSLEEGEKIQIDFEDIFTMSPSWAAEFILMLKKEYGDRVELLPTNNEIIAATMDFLAQIAKK